MMQVSLDGAKELEGVEMKMMATGPAEISEAVIALTDVDVEAVGAVEVEVAAGGGNNGV